MIVFRNKEFSTMEMSEIEQNYFKKYPKLRELEVYIKNRNALKRIQLLLDDLSIIKDWTGLESDFDDPDGLFEDTLIKIQKEMKSDKWIPCLGLGESLSYNTADGMFYELDLYSRNKLKRKYSSLKEYNKCLIKDIQDCINKTLEEYPEDYKPSAIKTKVDSIIPSLKKILKL